MTRRPLPLRTTTAGLTGNEATCVLVNLCVGHVCGFEYDQEMEISSGGVTVTYSCFLSRAKPRTAGMVTHPREVDGIRFYH